MDKVRIQLKWFHQFQFAGYYAAVEKGFYREEGFDVTLLPRDPNSGFIETVLAGGAEYGVSDSGLLPFRAQGKPVVLLAQIFQHSPLVFLAQRDSGIISPYEMIGKKVIFDYAGRSDAPLYAMLLETIEDVSKIDIEPMQFDLKPFIDGEIDVTSAYLTDQAFILRKQGIEVNIINPQNYGIDFYGDNFFTTESEIQNHPDRVRKMVRATLKGWHYALRHKDEIIDLILEKYAPDRDREHLEFEARMTEMMILPDLIPLGEIIPKRYEKIASTYARLGFIPNEGIPQGFINPSSIIPISGLSMEEKNWLVQQHKVCVFLPDLPPLTMVKNGKPEGLAVDYLEEIAGRTGITFEYAPATTPLNFNHQTLVQEKSIDLHPIHPGSVQSENHFVLTQKYITNSSVIICPENNHSIVTIDDLRGKSISVLDSSPISNSLRTEYPDIHVVSFSPPIEVLRAITEGKVKAAILNGFTAEYLINHHPDLYLKIAGNAHWQGVPISMAIRSDWPELASIINRALDSMSLEKRLAIHAKWIPWETQRIRQEKLQESTSLKLTDIEQQWLKEHPVIRVGSDHNTAPIEFLGPHGNYEGVAIEYLQHIENMLGIQFDIARGISWHDLLNKCKTGEIDLLTAAAITPDRREFLNYTTPFLDIPVLIFTRDNITYIGGIKEIEDRKVAVIRGFAAHESLRRDYPNMQIVPADTYKEALDWLARGEVDVFVGSILSTSYYISQFGYANIKVAGETPYKFQLAMASRKDWPILGQILQKALDTLPESRKRAIYQKWVSVKYAQEFDYSLLWKILGIVGAIIALFIYWNRRLSQEVSLRTQELSDANVNLQQEMNERKKAEKTILESEHRYRALFESSSDAILLLKDGCFVDCNSEAIKLFGCQNKNQLLKKTPLDFWPPLQPNGKSSEEQGSQHLSQTNQAYPHIFEWLHCRMDGSTFDTEVSLSVIDIDGEPHLLCNVRDITDRKRAEAERLRLTTAIEQAAEHIMITDTEGILEYVNPAFEKGTGYAREEILGKHVSLLEKDDLPKSYYQELWQIVNAGKTWSGRFENRKKDGSIAEMEASIVPIRTPSGEIVSFLSVQRDITHEKELESQLRQAQKMEAIGTLAGGIAHDFNNILSAILGYGELALHSAFDPNLRENIEEVLQAGNRAKHLVSQILTFSRQSKQEKKPTLLQPIVKETIKLLRASIPSTIELRTSIHENCPPIMADPTGIHQVLMNLCTNAYQAMREYAHTENSVKRFSALSVELKQLLITHEHTATLPELPPGEYARITVSDTGIGMDPTIVPRIFDPYFTTKEKGEGTGLGLSTAHSIIQNHGGKITVYSEPDVGTTFHIYLPICRIEMDAGQRESKHESLPANVEHILFVDDEQALTQLGQKTLESYGFRVSPCENSLEALSLFKKNPKDYDLVITDLNMPQMNGYELAGQLLTIRPETPIILCTGFSETLTRKRAREAGIRELLTKPIAGSELAKAIRRVLDHPQNYSDRLSEVFSEQED